MNIPPNVTDPFSLESWFNNAMKDVRKRADVSAPTERMFRNFFVLGWQARGQADLLAHERTNKAHTAVMHSLDLEAAKHWSSVEREHREMDDEINRLMEE